MKQQIAIYLRLSLEDTDSSDESNSISAQRLLIHRYLDQDAALGNLPRTEFCDDGYSGTNFDRPDFQRMIEMTRQGQISCIVVKDMSRFGRDYLAVGDYLEHIFPFLGIRFLSVNDHYDSEKNKGKTIGLDLTFQNLIYDYYSKDLSQKVKSAMEIRQRASAFVTCVPYGYRTDPDDKHHMIIEPESAAIVRRIFTDIIAGKTSTEIAKQLNTEGIRTRSAYKGVKRSNPDKVSLWTHKAVLEIVENIKYTGTMVNHTRESRFIRDKNLRHVPKEEWYMKENAHEAIVTQDKFQAAQAAVHRRKKYIRQMHDLSDRVYYCGHCGTKLEKANGTVFACPSRRFQADSPCSKVHWRKTELEAVVLASLKQQIKLVTLENASIRKTAERNKKNYQRQSALLSSQIDAVSREKLDLYEKFREAGMAAADYLDQKNKLTEKEAVLKAQLTECSRLAEEAQNKINIAKNQTVNQLNGLSDQKLQAHLYDAIERIQVYDSDSIEITWKFNDIKTDTKDKATLMQ